MSRENIKVLIIDDEEDFCYFTKLNLEDRSNYEVMTAKDGYEGLQMARAKKPDIILLDITMPKMSGIEVLKKLKLDHSTVAIPVLMITAKKDMATKIEAAIEHDYDYIEKPVKIETLRLRVENALSRLGIT